MNVILYARVSSDAQDTELSLGGQLRALREWALKNGHTVVREFVDEAQSGRSADRPAFREMIDYGRLESHPADAIAVWKHSRFARDRRDSVTYKFLLQRAGVRVISINEPSDDTPAGRMLTGVIEAIDEFYSDNLGQDISRGMSEAAALGFFVGSHPPYGYRKVPVEGQRRTRWTLEPEPGEAELVARMFRSIAGGMGLTRLARELNAEGYRTRGGARWSKVSLGKLLKKYAYTGTLVWNTGSFRKLGEPVEPVRIEGAWPALVERTLFDRAQASLHSRAPAVMHPRQVAGSFLLAGLVFCSGCGAAMTSHSAKSGRYHYYACSARTKGRDDGCTQPLTRREVLENAIIARTRNRLLSDDNLAELVDLVNQEIAGHGQGERGSDRQPRPRDWRGEQEAGEVLRLLRARGAGPCGDEPAGIGVEGPTRDPAAEPGTACRTRRGSQLFSTGGQGTGSQAEGVA